MEVNEDGFAVIGGRVLRESDETIVDTGMNMEEGWGNGIGNNWKLFSSTSCFTS